MLLRLFIMLLLLIDIMLLLYISYPEYHGLPRILRV
jgi:hypothetical protein